MQQVEEETKAKPTDEEIKPYIAERLMIEAVESIYSIFD